MARADSKTEASKASDLKSGRLKMDQAKTAGSKASNVPQRKPEVSEDEPKFVDRQLQKTVEYLTTELARAQ